MVSSCAGTVVPDGGERCTARPTAGSDGTSCPDAKAQPRKRRAGSAARRDDEVDLTAYVKKVVDALPPLTDGQRDLIALIFRNQHQ
jgi:hypothetical protein